MSSPHKSEWYTEIIYWYDFKTYGYATAAGAAAVYWWLGGNLAGNDMMTYAQAYLVGGVAATAVTQVFGSSSGGGAYY